MPHQARPVHLARHPVHVTLRARRVFPLVRAALAAASGSAFRLVHVSVQADHVHLLVEGRDKAALSLGMRGLVIRLARAVNRARGRRGAVWADRYHARALTTPREVRYALVYILMNYKKHPVAAPRTWLGRDGWRRYGLIGLDERPQSAASLPA